MTDKIVLNRGIGGESIVVEEAASGVLIPVSKIHLGTDGVDGGPVTEANPFPVAASSLPLPTGAATQATLAALSAKVPALGSAASAASSPVVIASDQTAVPVSAASLPLPSGAATESTLSTISGRTPALGQAAMAASSPVVIASNQTAVPVSAASLPLPSGAATQATLEQLAGRLPPSLDAFARLKVSHPVTIFDSAQQFGDDSALWENAVTGTGAVSAVTASAAVRLTTGGTAAGASAVRSTRQYHRYQPGKSQLAYITFVLGAAVDGVRRRVGYFDANNGLFLEQTIAGVRLVQRSNVSGSPSDAVYVDQGDWNIDTLDGFGPSGIALDWTKANFLVIQLPWQGVGDTLIGFVLAGTIVYAHRFANANARTAVYMHSGSLPVRFEVENTGTAAGIATLDNICTAVISEGGQDPQGKQFTANMGITPESVTTREVVMALRAKATGPGGGRNTGQIMLRDFDLTATGSNGFLWELVVGGTITGSSWAAHDANRSIAEVDVVGGTISGGVVVDSGYVTAGANFRGTASPALVRLLPLVYSALGNVQDSVALVCTSLNATSNPIASMTWQEVF